MKVKCTTISYFLKILRHDADVVKANKWSAEKMESFIKKTAERYPDFNYAPTRVIGAKKRWEGL
jgi:hypothetical protein